jgi:HlyD family type I secretion membrane fusion protein
MSKMSKTKPKTSKDFSPSPYVIAGYATIFLAFGVFGTWAATAPLSGAIVSTGTVSVESNRKIIQHLEGGIVSEILVNEGTIVEPGDVLLRLDDTSARGNFAVLQTRMNVLQATEARLLAESVAAPEVTWPEVLSASDSDLVKQAVSLEQTRFNDRKRTKDGLISIQEARIDQLNEGIAGMEQQLTAITGRLDSLNEEVERLTRGQEGGVVATNQLSQFARSLLELQGQEGQVISEIAKQRQAIVEAQLNIVQVGQEYVEQAGNELRDIRDQLSEVQERVTVAQDILTRTVVTAPVRGMVQNMQIHTTGGVVRAAEPIMDVIPLDDDLIVSARVRPVDIDSVGIGMPAEVRFAAFSSRTTPVIFGEVKVVSQDVIEPTRQGEEPYYLARVEVSDENVPEQLKGRLVPGMPADIFIATGERTMVEYLLKPLEDSFSKGMREQ